MKLFMKKFKYQIISWQKRDIQKISVFQEIEIF